LEWQPLQSPKFWSLTIGFPIKKPSSARNIFDVLTAPNGGDGWLAIALPLKLAKLTISRFHLICRKRPEMASWPMVYGTLVLGRAKK
jgi:hypothetical protein